MNRGSAHLTGAAASALTDAAGDTSRATDAGRRPVSRSTTERRLLLVVALVVVVLAALSAGGGRAWQWTGLHENDRLWDWLHLLLVPVALAVLPVWLRQYGGRYAALWRAGAALLAVAAAVVIAGGYLVPWRWTGFAGNTLWQWLQLLLLPVSISLVPQLIDRRGLPGRRLLPAAVLVAAIFVVLVVGGYAVPWRWTGFTDNTLWEWLELLLVPFALPLTVTLVVRTGEQHAGPSGGDGAAQHRDGGGDGRTS